MCCCVQISPNTLFLIEGSGQSWQGAMNWGDGFITDQNLISQRGMSNPNPFFISLLSKPYLNNVVIAPHYYPPSISHATSQCAPSLDDGCRLVKESNSASRAVHAIVAS